jgi:hypothetical protein
MIVPKRYEIIHKDKGLIKSFRSEKKVEKYLRKQSNYIIYNLEIYSWINHNIVRWKINAEDYMNGYFPRKDRASD